MKAMVIERFGGPEQLKLTDLPTPTPQRGEVQVEVAYASVNPVDYKICQGHLKERLPHHFPIILGWDAAGTISAVGADVKDFKVGDKVYSYCRKPAVQFGSYAEYVCIDAKSVAMMPRKVSFAEAACIPLVGLTAWQAVMETAGVKKGDKVLIHAGAGGVGGLAIQFAVATGAHVWTTATEKNHAYVQELGAELAIDYTKESFVDVARSKMPQGFDIIFDCVGGETLKNSYSLVKSGGHLVSIVDTPDEGQARKNGIRAHYHFVNPSGQQLRQIAHFVDSGKVRPLPFEEMALKDAAEALQKSITRHVRGKIVLKVK